MLGTREGNCRKQIKSKFENIGNADTTDYRVFISFCVWCSSTSQEEIKDDLKICKWIRFRNSERRQIRSLRRYCCSAFVLLIL